MHLMHTEGAEGHVFNVAAETVSFDEAFQGVSPRIGALWDVLFLAREAVATIIGISSKISLRSQIHSLD